MNLENVYDIWDRFEKSDIDEINIEIDDDRLSLKRSRPASRNSLDTNICLDKVTEDTGLNHSNDSSNMVSKSNKSDRTQVKAPLVGTFYAASSPGEEPFVNVGDVVKKGDVIGIIEAMKLMNEITAPQDGVVREILIDNGEMVEYDQVIMRIE